MKKITLYCITLLLVFSCCTHSNTPWETAQKTLENHQEIINLKPDFNLSNFSLINSENIYWSEGQVANCRHLIVNLINTECGNCLVQLARWSDIIKENDTLFKDIPVVFITEGSYSEYFEHWVMKDRVIVPVYYDTEENLRESQYYFSLRKENTMLIDKVRGPLIVGSPIHSPHLLETYIYITKSLAENED